MGKRDRISAEKNRISAAAAGEASASASNNRLTENLKTVNGWLLKEATKCRKEIEHLRSQLTTMADEYDIVQGIESDIFELVLSSTLREADGSATAEMAAATEKERKVVKEMEYATVEINAVETELIALAEEKDAKEKELAELKERIRSIEEARERGRRPRKWLYSAITAAFMAAAAALIAFCSTFKK